MSRDLFTVVLSLMLHLIIAGYLFYLTQTPISQQNKAQFDAPIISIALTQAVEEVQPVPIETTKEIPTESLIDLAKIIESAAIIVPKKPEKAEKKANNPIKVNKPKTSVMAKKIEQPLKEPNKLTKTETDLAQQQTGHNVFSQSTGIKGNATQQASGDTNKQLISEYREKLRQEVERHKQYPRRAKKMQTRGIVEIQFQLSHAGDITLVRLMASSGSELLDNAALAAVAKSRSVGKPPVGFAQSVMLNIEFN